MSSDEGSHSEVIPASAEVVLAALTDYAGYPRWQAGVSSTRVLQRADDSAVVESVVDAKVRTVRFTARYYLAEPDLFAWDYLHGDLRDNSGRYRLVALDDRRTRLQCQVRFDAGFFVPAPVRRAIAGQALSSSLRRLAALVREPA